VNTSSRHLLAEYWDCERDLLDDPGRLEVLLRRAAEAAGVSVLSAVFHRFSPQGVSGVLVLQESHLSIHSWPEAGYAAVDLYTCGIGDPFAAHRVLEAGLGAARCATVLLRRGDNLPPRIVDPAREPG
jgi:S-adenosylmethionine decarboxylase proenzyme